MSRYTTWPLVTGRYPLAASKSQSGAPGAENYFIVGAEDEIDGYAGQFYTVPFSPAPGFIVDLATDLAYLKMNRDNKPLAEDVQRRIDLLLKGAVTLVVSGSPLLSGNAAWAENEFHTSFGHDDPINWSVDSGQIAADRDMRGAPWPE